MIANSCQFCPGCGRKFYNSFGRFLKWAFTSMFGLVALSFLFASLSNNPTSTSPPAPVSVPASKPGLGKTLPASDQRYVRASIEYLSSANAAGTQMATVWAGASDGTSTLEDCHIAANKGFLDENARYSAYRANRGSVPPAFAAIDRHIGEIHKKSMAGLSSILSYWTSGNLNSLSRGMDMYKAAILEMNSTIAEGTAVMKGEAR